MYATVSDIRNVMTKLPPQIKDEDIEFYIKKATTLVDSHLKVAYVTPFNPVPELIKHITIDLAIFFLAESLYSSQMPNFDEYQVKRYERAISMLEKIAIGDLMIDAPQRSNYQSGFASTNDEPPIFTLDEPYW
jgi:phage gp36-like protein